ncbi:RNA polymerase factor sigma-32 [Ancylobacter dichloromethanicus]|uniref:RNA polymerase factor sigma-32 n=1 Tax=Ancylobacter dichloromethanicus TaxID=518825 RepID=A0A9W6JA38_9HYPH|nr:RNA polymerase factor sigma-32 [Ancylobacter dichloromethanicus]MBS7555680.1 RNA polymerase factor sigma-32 [Ancylobacter dichloromethanicus]GLK73177.1 RNA polymerase factor sigma-32 [Ancylobacter dichloromethanicus]
MSEQAGRHTQLARAAMATPLLERDQEYDLARRWSEQRDEKALHALIHAHMRLALSIARRFRNYGLPMSDLVQEGHIGLMEAAARFETARDVRFSTYATWWIRAAIQDYVLRNWSIVRGGTSSGQKALFFNLRRVRGRLERANEGAAPPTREELHRSIAEKLGVSSTEVARMDARLNIPDLSLNAPLAAGEEEGTERLDQLVAQDPLPDEQATHEIDGERRRRWLIGALRGLNEREFRIIKARRLNEESETLEVLGARLGISKERVRQIESRAIEKLRFALTNGPDVPRGAFSA